MFVIRMFHPFGWNDCFPFWSILWKQTSHLQPSVDWVLISTKPSVSPGPMRQNLHAALSRYGSATTLHVSLLMKHIVNRILLEDTHITPGRKHCVNELNGLVSEMSCVDISGILLSPRVSAWELGPDSVSWRKFPEFHCLKFSVAKRVLDCLHCDNIYRRNGLNFKGKKAFYKWVTPVAGKRDRWTNCLDTKHSVSSQSLLIGQEEGSGSL